MPDPSPLSGNCDVVSIWCGNGSMPTPPPMVTNNNFVQNTPVFENKQPEVPAVAENVPFVENSTPVIENDNFLNVQADIPVISEEPKINNESENKADDSTPVFEENNVMKDILNANMDEAPFEKEKEPELSVPIISIVDDPANISNNNDTQPTNDSDTHTSFFGNNTIPEISDVKIEDNGMTAIGNDGLDNNLVLDDVDEVDNTFDD